MPLTQQQAQEIKEQLFKQVENIPNADHEQIKNYIKDLDEQGLEQFLKQNKIQITDTGQLAQEGAQEGQPPASEKPIFESIIQGEIPSYKLDENQKSIAILEINPLSKGHSLVLPKQKTTTEKIPKSAMTLAQKLAKKIKLKLKPEDIKIETFSFQDYPAINIIPIYKDKKLEKTKAQEKDLEELQKKLQVKKRGPRVKKPKQMSAEEKKQYLKSLPEIPFRIP